MQNQNIINGNLQTWEGRREKAVQHFIVCMRNHDNERALLQNFARFIREHIDHFTKNNLGVYNRQSYRNLIHL
jgi:hypothetical protein